MSKDWVKDIHEMHSKFGVHDWVKKKIKEGDNESLKKFLEFRGRFLEEELTETLIAIRDGNAEEVVDGLIDLCVVAIGTLDAFDIDGYKAWDEILKCNMAKEPGVKPNRPNPLGLPDLMKPKDWKGPDHSDNHGMLSIVLKHEEKVE